MMWYQVGDYVRPRDAWAEVGPAMVGKIIGYTAEDPHPYIVQFYGGVKFRFSGGQINKIPDYAVPVAIQIAQILGTGDPDA